MKIIFQNNPYFIRADYNSSCKNTICRYNPTHKDIVSFKSTSQIPERAIKYLNSKKIELYSLGFDKYFLPLFEAKKLEGIQNGIPIFKGSNFSQIAHLAERLRGVILQSGCDNNCIHCFADAQTPYHLKTNNLAEKIDFEDYENFCNGFKELNKRLDFNVFPPSSRGLFYDSDCSMIYLHDKNGKMYDYADLAKMLHETTEGVVLFDTSGWNPNDKKTQKRMEDLVQKIASSDEYNFIKFNISINPFHSIYNKSVELKEKGNIEKAQKLRGIYTDRIANTIFTFSPLLNKTIPLSEENQVNLIFRSLPNSTSLNGYREDDLNDLCSEILKKFEKMFDNAHTSNSATAIRKDYLSYIRLSLNFPCPAYINLSNKKLMEKLKDIPYDEYSNLERKLYNSAEAGKIFDEGFIDLNGIFYLTNYAETYPTETVLNYKNKNKPTAPMAPNLRDEVITKDMIEQL